MVVRLALAAVALTVAGGAVAMPVSFRVVSAHVVHTGVFSAEPANGQTPAQCARFRLSDRAALRYFVKAREVDEHRWRETLDWTQCSAAGMLRTGDGKTYRWTIDQSGRGLIIVTANVSVYLDGQEFPGAR